MRVLRVRRSRYVRAIAALGVAVLLVIPATAWAATRHDDPDPPEQKGAPSCTAEESRQRLASHLRAFKAAGWTMTPAAAGLLGGADLRSVVADGTIKLAHGNGKDVLSVPARKTALRKAARHSRGKASPDARPKRVPASASGHQPVNLNCDFGQTGHLMWWTGATAVTYANYVERNITGGEQLFQTNHHNCSVVEAPCLYISADGTNSAWRVITALAFARYASHSNYDAWCSWP